MVVGAMARHHRVPYVAGVDEGPSPAVRWRRRAVAGAVLLAVAWPVVRGHDSFPLSTYPMYAETRGKDVSISTAVGVDGSGSRRRLSLRAIAQTDDPLIAESAVDDAVRRGEADALCAEIALRVPDGIERVEVVAERHDVVARAAGRPSLLDRSVRASCGAR
jgi:hypothetical protein